MKYIKFILKCIIAALPIAAIVIFTYAAPMCYMDKEYPSWKYTKEVSSGKIGEQHYDTVILGDSGAMSSFIPDMLSDSAVNLAVGGGTSIEMYYFLKEYLEQHDKPEQVVIMFQPFHYFNIDNYETRTMYFKALSVEDARDLYTVAKECGTESVYKGEESFWNELSCRLALPTKYLPAITAARFVGRYKDNISSFSNLVDSKGYGSFGELDGCDEISYECSYSGIERGPDMYLLLTYFIKLNELCQSNDIACLLLQPAINEASFEQLNPDYLADIYGLYNAIGQSSPGMIVEDELRVYPNELFGDVSHLNRKGAKIFSQEIKEKYSGVFE